MEIPESFQLLYESTLENSRIELKDEILSLFTREKIDQSISDLINVMIYQQNTADNELINGLIRLFLIELDKTGIKLEDYLANPDHLNSLKALSLFFLNKSLVQLDIQALDTYYRFIQKQNLFTERVVTPADQQQFIANNNIKWSTMCLLCTLYEYDRETSTSNFHITKKLIQLERDMNDKRPGLFYLISEMLNWWQKNLILMSENLIAQISNEFTPIFIKAIEFTTDPNIGQNLKSYLFDKVWKSADGIIGLSFVDEIVNIDLNGEILYKILPTIISLLSKAANDFPNLQKTLDAYSWKFYNEFLELYFDPQFIDWQHYYNNVDILFNVHSQAVEVFNTFINDFRNYQFEEKIRGYPLLAHFLAVMNPDNIDVTPIIDDFFQDSVQSEDEEIIRCFYDASYLMIFSVNSDLITEGLIHVIENTFKQPELLEYSTTFMMEALSRIPISNELAQGIHSILLEFLDNQSDDILYFMQFYESKTIECEQYIRFLNYLSNIDLNSFDESNMMTLYFASFFLLLFETNPIEGFTQENHNQYHSIFVQKLFELINLEFDNEHNEIKTVVVHSVTNLINLIIDLYGSQIDPIYLDILGFILDFSLSAMQLNSSFLNELIEIGEMISPFLLQDHPLFAKYAQLATKFMVSPLQSIYLKAYINPEAFIEQRHEINSEMFEYLVPFTIDRIKINLADYCLNIDKIKFAFVNGYDSLNAEKFIMNFFKAYNISATSFEMIETCLLAMALGFQNHQQFVFHIAIQLMQNESLLRNQRVKDVIALLLAALIHRYTPQDQYVELYQQILDNGISEARHADCELLVAKYSQNMETTKNIIDNFDIDQTVLHCHITKIFDELLGNEAYSELRLVLYEIAACYESMKIDVSSDNIDFANYVTRQTKLQMRRYLLNCCTQFPDIYSHVEAKFLQRKAYLRYHIFPMMQQ